MAFWFHYLAFGLSGLVLALGLFGNFSTLIIIKRSNGSSKTHNVIIMALAAADTLSLITSFIKRQYIFDLFSSNIQMNLVSSAITCRLFSTIFMTAISFSNALVAMICIERFIVIWLPLKSRYILSKLKVTVCIAVVALVIFAFSMLHSLVDNNSINGACLNEPLVVTNQEVDPLAVANYFIFIAVPALILLLLTPTIIFKLYRLQAVRMRLTVQERKVETYRTSVMLTGILVAYICLNTAPCVLYLILLRIGIDIRTKDGSWRDVVGTSATFAMQVSYATNFILYSVLNTNFRRHFFNLLGCKRLRESPDSK